MFKEVRKNLYSCLSHQWGTKSILIVGILNFQQPLLFVSTSATVISQGDFQQSQQMEKGILSQLGGEDKAFTMTEIQPTFLLSEEVQCGVMQDG